MNMLKPFSKSDSDVFGDFHREMDNLVLRMLSHGGNGVGDWYNPSTNISESENDYEITLDLPGISADDVTVEMKHGDLWISGERKHGDEVKGKKYHRFERQYGRFQRVLHLGDGLDADKVDAQYRDGVLRIVIPKTEAAKPRRIEIHN